MTTARRSNFFFITLFAVTILLFLLLHPKISAMVIRPIRDARWDAFVQGVRKHNRVDGKTFWKTREFYSPGHFTFQQKGLPREEVSAMLKRMNVSIVSGADFYAFQAYYSHNVLSIEALVKTATLSSLIRHPQTSACIIRTPSHMICSLDSNRTFIAFSKPMEEMQETNGFLDYARDDVRRLVSGKRWLNISIVTAR